MARTAIVFTVLVLIGIAAGAAKQAEPKGDVPADALPPEGLPPGADGMPPGGDEESVPIDNPEYEKHMVMLKELCMTIESDMLKVFADKQHHQAEMTILAHAGELGVVLEERAETYKRTHETWTCKEAKEFIAHERTATFIRHFDNWFNGKEVFPEVSQAQALKLIRRLRTDLTELRLTNEETVAEMQDIEDDLEHLNKWRVALKKEYDAIMKHDSDTGCEPQWAAFMATLHEMHGEKVPNWYHVAEGVKALHKQCKDDPALKDEEL